MAKAKTKPPFIGCTLKTLPPEMAIESAAHACGINPANMPAVEMFCSADEEPLSPVRLAYLTGKFWGSAGAKLSVYFMDNPTKACRRKILDHLNRWHTVAGANATFSETSSTGSADIRIARSEGQGYYSYLGTDCRLVDKSEPTMNLDSFTEFTSDAEYLRVPPHEGGHALGFFHEHLRPELIAKLDPAKTIAVFRRDYGWTEAMTRHNVLTAPAKSTFRGTGEADPKSIMCYRISGECTKDGKPIAGGDDLSPEDCEFGRLTYPPVVPPAEQTIVIRLDSKIVKLAAGWKVQG